MAVTVSFATRASRLKSGGVIPASTGRPVKHTQRHCAQAPAHLSAAGASQTAEETVPGVHFALEAFEMFFCASGTGRESHQGKPGCYCSEEENRSQLHRAVDVCPCYLGGMLSSWS